MGEGLKKRASMPVKKYILTMKSDLTDLEKLRSFVEEIREKLSFSKKCQFETNLALEEAFSNILSYGFDKHPDHFIKITITSASPLRTSPTQAYSPSYFTWEEWAFLHVACARLIPTDENGPGAVELGVPEFIDREMDGAFGHAANWYMQGPFASAPPELGYQSQLTPRAVYAGRKG